MVIKSNEGQLDTPKANLNDEQQSNDISQEQPQQDQPTESKEVASIALNDINISTLSKKEVGNTSIVDEHLNNNIAIHDRSISTDSLDMVTPESSSRGDNIDIALPVEVIGLVQEGGEDFPMKRIRIGICAMDKKAKSKPMSEILKRLDKNDYEIVSFGDGMILNEEVEMWPECDVLIAFYSSGYPLEKAEKYAELHPEMYVINDLKMQHELKDRRRVYDLLKASGIDVPRHVFLNRDGYVSRTSVNNLFNRNNDDTSSMIQSQNLTIGDDEDETELIENDDNIIVNGVTISKPFVEKPVDADDHNIAIYYPYSAGGGCKKLFRKVMNRSSEFYPEINEVRRDGSYIYEEYVETQGIDVKTYTVGSGYGHAEARKSPTVDGKVERNEDGKEVRFPVILSPREKEITRRIVEVFKQQVCGFDLLRVQEGDEVVPYVCDVNGWSFVKKSQKYYEDCAQILNELMLAKKKPQVHHGFSTNKALCISVQNFSIGQHNAAVTLEEGAEPVRNMSNVDPSATLESPMFDDESTSSKGTTKGTQETHQEELRCVLTVVRHGDRTPKQKLKVKLSEPQLLHYFHKYSDNCKQELKVKDKQPLSEFLDTINDIVEAMEKDDTRSEPDEVYEKVLHMRDILQKWKIGGLNRKLQMKPTKWNEYITDDGSKFLKCSQVQLILKWGGNLTKLGEKQAINLGQRFRNEMYPQGDGGILRLHSTFRHDLKIKTSDEGRVMKTAAAFAKGLLELEGEIPPILVSLVHKEKNSHHMLDPSGNKEVKKILETCKKRINTKLQEDIDVSQMSGKELEPFVGPKGLLSLHSALRKVGNPRKVLFEIRVLIGKLLVEIEAIKSEKENEHEGGEGLKCDDENDEALCGIKLYKGETMRELKERWRLLYTKLYDEEKDKFDLSRIPDVHDNARFDMLHNPETWHRQTLEDLYHKAKLMADCVVPQEYGTSIKQKREIGSKMCGPLLMKIKDDLHLSLRTKSDNQTDFRYPTDFNNYEDLPCDALGRQIRTRLYFTSESHLHTLLNVLRYASASGDPSLKIPLSQKGAKKIARTPEICYLTQIVMRLFENKSKPKDDKNRFRIEILFGPGASATPMHKSDVDKDVRVDTEGLTLISKRNLTYEELDKYFQKAIDDGKDSENDDDEKATLSVRLKGDVNLEMFDQASPRSPRSKKSMNGKDEKKTKSTVDKKVSFASEPDTENKSIGENKEKRNLSIEKIDNGTDSINEEKESPQSDEIDSEKNGNESKDVEEEIKDATNESKDLEDECNDLEDERVKEMAVILARQYFWTSVAAVSFFLGVGCLILSREIGQSDFKTRRWTRRR